jgi:hypothetical protein
MAPGMHFTELVMVCWLRSRFRLSSGRSQRSERDNMMNGWMGGSGWMGGGMWIWAVVGVLVVVLLVVAINKLSTK